MDITIKFVNGDDNSVVIKILRGGGSLVGSVLLSIVLSGLLCLVFMQCIRAIGFDQQGIRNGSWAAWWHSGAGPVMPGSTFAVLQSLGMTGLNIGHLLSGAMLLLTFMPSIG
ncbi:uncharacterized protein LOC142573935 [Dermacentor variabilis]|uniref:uncharacterized protein LOC142573935 n=1 Tax=Dermacentor variabilis TaxID=34621 RepID=UPI003F5BE232